MATPLMHDSPGEIAQAEVKDWREGECEPIPGKTMPNLTVATRDYPETYRMMTALGPLAEKVGVGSKGIMWKAVEEVEALKESLGTVKDGIAKGRPVMETEKQAAETILTLAPETNGATVVKSWGILEKRTGLSLRHLSLKREGERFRFDDLTVQPRKIITSPVWSGIESEDRRYSPFVINIEEKVPFRTLTGRGQSWAFCSTTPTASNKRRRPPATGTSIPRTWTCFSIPTTRKSSAPPPHGGSRPTRWLRRADRRCMR